MILCKERKKRRECCSPTLVIWIALATGAGALGALAVCRRREACRAIKNAGKKCADALDHAVDRMCGDGECDCE